MTQLGWTDVLPEFGGDTAYGSDNFMQLVVVTAFATYRNTDFFGLVDGLNFAVQYLGKNGSVKAHGQQRSWRSASERRRCWRFYQLTITKASVSVVLMVPAPTVPTLQEAPLLTSATATVLKPWAGGLKYDANNIYLAANYGETRRRYSATH